jgi:hypothetical protein
MRCIISRAIADALMSTIPDLGQIAKIVSGVKSPLHIAALIVIAILILLVVIAVYSQGANQLILLSGAVLVSAFMTLYLIHTGRLSLTGLRSREEDRFIRIIVGRWWQRTEQVSDAPHPDPGKISYVKVELDLLSGELKMNGAVYNDLGKYISNWRTLATHVDVSKQELSYMWIGVRDFKRSDSDRRVGFGQMRFSGENLDFGEGGFTDSSEKDERDLHWKRIKLKRAIKNDEQEMGNANPEEIHPLAQKRLMEMSG